MKQIIRLKEIYSEYGEFDTEEDFHMWNFMEENLLYNDGKRHLPILVFSFVRPTLGPQFILHILLSMDQFETEIDMILHPTLRESLRYAKLIGPLDDEDSLKVYSSQFLSKYITEQLVNFPNSMKVLSQWILTASNLFDSIIFRNEIPITDMPPAHQTALNESNDEKVINILKERKGHVLSSAQKEMELCNGDYPIPTYDEFMGCSRQNALQWGAISNFKINPNQSQESYLEKMIAVKNTVSAIDNYNNYTGQCDFVKFRVIAGSPGSGKSYIFNYCALYAMSKGLKVSMTALMAQRAVHLGGIHLHKLFYLPVHKNMSVNKVGDFALKGLLHHPVSLTI